MTALLIAEVILAGAALAIGDGARKVNKATQAVGEIKSGHNSFPLARQNNPPLKREDDQNTEKLRVPRLQDAGNDGNPPQEILSTSVACAMGFMGSLFFFANYPWGLGVLIALTFIMSVYHITVGKKRAAPEEASFLWIADCLAQAADWGVAVSMVVAMTCWAIYLYSMQGYSLLLASYLVFKGLSVTGWLKHCGLRAGQLDFSRLAVPFIIFTLIMGGLFSASVIIGVHRINTYYLSMNNGSGKIDGVEEISDMDSYIVLARVALLEVVTVAHTYIVLAKSPGGRPWTIFLGVCALVVVGIGIYEAGSIEMPQHIVTGIESATQRDLTGL